MNIYPSYSGKPEDAATVIEHTLRFADVEEIKSILKEYGFKKCLEIWQIRLIPDERLKKLNYFLAKFIFEVAESDEETKEYLQRYRTTRGERINGILNR
jgi:hypothetical protein